MDVGSGNVSQAWPNHIAYTYFLDSGRSQSTSESAYRTNKEMCFIPLILTQLYTRETYHYWTLDKSVAFLGGDFVQSFLIYDSSMHDLYSNGQRLRFSLVVENGCGHFIMDKLQNGDETQTWTKPPEGLHDFVHFQ